MVGAPTIMDMTTASTRARMMLAVDRVTIRSDRISIRMRTAAITPGWDNVQFINRPTATVFSTGTTKASVTGNATARAASAGEAHS